MLIRCLSVSLKFRIVRPFKMSEWLQFQCIWVSYYESLNGRLQNCEWEKSRRGRFFGIRIQVQRGQWWFEKKKMLIEILDQPALQVNNFISTSYGLAIPHLSNIHAFAFLSFFFENPRTPPSYVPSSLLYKLWMSQRIKLGVFHCSTLFHCSTVMPLTSHGRTWIERPLDWSIKSWEVSRRTFSSITGSHRNLTRFSLCSGPAFTQLPTLPAVLLGLTLPRRSHAPILPLSPIFPPTSHVPRIFDIAASNQSSFPSQLPCTENIFLMLPIPLPCSAQELLLASADPE